MSESEREGEFGVDTFCPSDSIRTQYSERERDRERNISPGLNGPSFGGRIPKVCVGGLEIDR